MISYLHALVFLAEVEVHVLQVVDLLVEDVHVSQQTIVLLLPLDEYVLDLLDIGQAGCLLNGIERLVNNLHIPLVVVNKSHFLFIVNY